MLGESILVLEAREQRSLPYPRTRVGETALALDPLQQSSRPFATLLEGAFFGPLSKKQHFGQHYGISLFPVGTPS